MLRKKNRLTRAHFKSVRLGRALHTPSMTLRVQSGFGESRFSVVISSQVFKSAARRNRLRRQLYATLATLRSSIKKGRSRAIFLKKAAAGIPPKELQSELKKLLKQSDSVI